MATKSGIGMQDKFQLPDGRWVKLDTRQIATPLTPSEKELIWSEDELDEVNKDLILAEALMEVITSTILKNSNIIDLGLDYVEYSFYIEQPLEAIACVSDDFIGDRNTREEIRMMEIIQENFILAGLNYSNFLSMRGRDKLDYLMNKINVKNFREYIVVLFELDYITENPDRHLGNFGLILDHKKGIYIPTPVFDNGFSFNIEDIYVGSECIYSGRVPYPNVSPLIATHQEHRDWAREEYFGDKNKPLLIIDVDNALLDCRNVIYGSEYNIKIKDAVYKKVTDRLELHREETIFEGREEEKGVNIVIQNILGEIGTDTVDMGDGEVVNSHLYNILMWRMFFLNQNPFEISQLINPQTVNYCQRIVGQYIGEEYDKGFADAEDRDLFVQETIEECYIFLKEAQEVLDEQEG